MNKDFMALVVLITAVLIMGCAGQPRSEPSALVEASCPSPLTFDREPIGGWLKIYTQCRDAVLKVKS